MLPFSHKLADLQHISTSLSISNEELDIFFLASSISPSFKAKSFSNVERV